MRFLFLLLGLLLFCSIVYGQSTGLVEQAEDLLIEYEKTYEGGEETAAREYLDQGLKLLKGQGQDTLLGKYHNLYTYWYYQNGQLEEALAAQRKAAQLFQRGYGTAQPTAFALHNLAYLQSRIAGQPDSAIYYFEKAKAIYQSLGKAVDVADEWRNIGLIHIAQSNYPLARKAYLEGIAVLNTVELVDLKEKPEQEEAYIQTLSWLYLNLAEIASEEEDIRQLRIHLNYAQDVLLPYRDKYPLLAREAKENQARIYGFMGDAAQSLAHYQDLLSVLVLPKDVRIYLRILAKMAQVSSDIANDYERALSYWQQVLETNQQYSVTSKLNLVRYHREMAYCHLQLGYLSQADIYLSKAQNLLNEVPQAKEQAILFAQQARLAYLRGQKQLALEYLEKCSAQFAFPASSDRANIECLKGRVYYSIAMDTGQEKDFNNSEQWARKSLATLTDFEEQTFQRRSFGQYYRQPTELLLKCLSSRYEKTKRRHILEEIFALMEQSRGRSLRMGHHWQQAQMKYQHTNTWKHFSELERERLRLLNRRYQLAKNPADSSRLLMLSDSLVQINARWDELRRSLPYDNTLQPAVVTIPEVQSSLPDQQTSLLSYFYSDSLLLVLAITAEKVYYYHQNTNESQLQVINELALAVSQPGLFTDLSNHSYQAYQQFLAPILEQLPPDVNRLILLPDGALTEMPWPALCTEQIAGDDYRTWPYLIRSYQLSFLTYAGALKQAKTREMPEFSVACFAPTYPVVETIDTIPHLATLRNSAFWPLPGAQREAKAIKELHRGSAYLFTGQEAVASVFKARAPAFSVLHLAMHAVADNRYPDESYFLFPTDKQQLQAVSSLSLLEMDLQTELMILSACYAGGGPWRAGEGVQSLAYTLRQAGVASVVSNTWAVADQFSGRLMLDFHEQLREHIPLDEALQKAQLAFIAGAGNSATSHPFYWAGFRVQGNTSPIIVDQAVNIYRLLGLLVLLLIGFFLYYKSRKSELAFAEKE